MYEYTRGLISAVVAARNQRSLDAGALILLNVTETHNNGDWSDDKVNWDYKIVFALLYTEILKLDT